jgi:hypothetical protein
MNKEEIKNELISKFKTKYPNPNDINIESAPDDIVEIINDILGTDLTEDEKEELLLFLKPTNLYLITAAIKGY